MEINPRIFAFIALFGIVFALLYGSPFLFPHKNGKECLRKQINSMPLKI